MFRHLRTTLPALALGTALALGAVGASTAPARADSRDAVAVLGGIVALYAIGRAIDQRNDRRRPPTQLQHAPAPQYHAPAPQYHPPARPTQIVAPARCYREFHTRDGYFRGYAGHCLQRNVNHGLPDACAREYRTDRGPRIFYGGRCLAQYGWVREGQRGH